jgi:rhodanese-related sulfurtransferase
MKTINPTQFQELKDKKEITLIDVRTHEEYQLEHIE